MRRIHHHSTPHLFIRVHYGKPWIGSCSRHNNKYIYSALAGCDKKDVHIHNGATSLASARAPACRSVAMVQAQSDGEKMSLFRLL
jgi:hypothetical protein